MLGAIGLKAQCSSARTTGGLETLVRLAQDPSALVHEGYDSDVALLTAIAGSVKKGIVLVQFKYSDKGTHATIPPSEYRRILTSFDRARKAVGKDNGVVSAYYLVTNREYSLQTQNMIDGKAKGGKRNNLTAPQRTISSKLTHVSGIEPEFWEQSLVEYARKYGLRDDEIESGKGRLISAILGQTVSAGTREVHQAFLAQFLNGSPGAQWLTHDHLLDAIRANLAHEFGQAPAHHLVSRPNVQSKFAEFKDRAIIVITGAGGTGKTAALRRWVDCATATAFVSARSPRAATSCWISEEVYSWRTVAGPSESSSDAIARLCIANPSMSKPIVYLALDGIDEQSRLTGNVHHLRELLRWFCREDQEVRTGAKDAARAQLVVTCRDLKDFRPIWIRNVHASPGRDPDPPPTIELDVFSDAELSSLAQSERKRLGEPVYNRLARAAGGPLGVDSDEAAYLALPDANDSLRTQPGAREGLLRNPSLWEAFMALPDHLRLPFLDHDEAASAELAELVVGRFIQKLEVRSDTLAPDEAKLALARIAAATRTEGSSALTRAQWNDVGGQILGFGGARTKSLFTEALSAGLVEVDRDRWSWHYAFVEEYLASLDEGGA